MNARLKADLTRLSYGHPVSLGDNYIIVEQFQLPVGFDQRTIRVLIEIPDDYPLSPPGIGNHLIYVSSGITLRGRRLRDVYSHVRPKSGQPGFSWFCYQRIDWDPRCDDLVTVIDLVRANLTTQLRDPAPVGLIDKLKEILS